MPVKYEIVRDRIYFHIFTFFLSEVKIFLYYAGIKKE